MQFEPWVEMIDFNSIVNNPDFLMIKEQKNMNWLLIVSYDVEKSTTVVYDSIEMVNWDRQEIIGVNRYVAYERCYREPESDKKTFTSYRFIEKIIDENNNLIVIAIPEVHEVEDYEVEYMDE